MSEKLYFASDYMQGAHPAVLQRLLENNLLPSAGYGTDGFSEAAREKIRLACAAPEAEVFFLVGGTQANALVLTALLKPWQGVIAADSGHISVHEAGAIECGGHKVIALPQHSGKLCPAEVEACILAWQRDANREHIVMPGAVYISHPTEFGTLYSLSELESLSRICRANGLSLFLDGARLAYALACPENELSLPDLGRLCDAFYIGGTKCGCLFGEAVVFPRRGTVLHFFTIIKQRGALLAKGFVAAHQFDALFTDGLYGRIGETAIRAAARIREALTEKGYPLAFDSPTNQIFPILDAGQLARLSASVEMGFWENLPDGRTVMRLATSWATADADVDALIALL
ncbi:MAG: aminotransferase class V-fold PLP-dependent enzyme [Oscillospiraceae bacterium]|nr:aminotransferase class V-fold PLP-dependent enzyme [Oscillospiraceae bacterium]